MHDDPFSTHPDLVEMSTPTSQPPPLPASAKGSNTTKVLIAVLAVFVLVAGFGAWWLMSSTVPSGDYDDAVAELDATEAELADVRSETGAEIADLNGQVTDLNGQIATLEADAVTLGEQIDGLDDQIAAMSATNAGLEDANADLRGELATMRSDLDESNAQVALLTSSADELRAQLGEAAGIFEVYLYLDMIMTPDVYDDLVAAGVDFSLYDELLAKLGHDPSLENWVDDGGAWSHANAAVIEVGDDQLLDAWIRMNEADTAREWAIAVIDFYSRFNNLLYDAVTIG